MRHANVIAGLARCTPSELSLSVTINVLRVRYYLYFVDAFDRGLITPDLVLDWLNIVDERHILITNFFWKQLIAELPANRQVAIRTSSALSELTEVMRQRISAGRVPEAAELVRLLRDVDPLWALLPEGEIPRDLIQLGVMSYVIEELRSGVSKNNGDGPVGLIVENYIEWKIYYSTTRIAGFLQQNHRRLNFRILGMYPMGRMLIAGKSSPSALYWQDPGRYALNTRGEIVDLLVVARSLYASAMNGTTTCGLPLSLRTACACGWPSTAWMSG